MDIYEFSFIAFLFADINSFTRALLFQEVLPCSLVLLLKVKDKQRHENCMRNVKVRFACLWSAIAGIYKQFVSEWFFPSNFLSFCREARLDDIVQCMSGVRIPLSAYS